jgi:deoxyribose-phosphate aldolase
MTLDLANLTERDISKTIDHSLLRPELDDAFVADGCRVAAKYAVASVCVRPADVVRARAILEGSEVAVGTTIGFPHGNHLTAVKVFEAQRALEQGATELDMVIQIGALKSGRDADVEADIRAVVDVAHANGAIVKVIFENAYLTEDEKVRACHLSEAAGADFVKTSTGKTPVSATLPAAERMLEVIAASGRDVGIKPAGGIGTAEAAGEYIALAERIMGTGWVKPSTFRFGASGLLNALLAAAGEEAPAGAHSGSY